MGYRTFVASFLLYLVYEANASFLPRSHHDNELIREFREHVSAASPCSGVPTSNNYTMEVYNLTNTQGYNISTHVFIPVGVKLPIAVQYVQTPYPLNLAYLMSINPWAQALNTTCPALILQNLQGSDVSSGPFTFGNVGDEAQITLKWIKAQSWSNGVVFLAGGSAMGITAYLTNTGNIVADQQYARVRGATYEWATAALHKSIYQGGAMRYSLVGSLSSALNRTDYFKEVMQHESSMDPFWSNQTVTPADYAQVTWPSLHIPGWYDIFQADQIRAFEDYRTYSDPSVSSMHKLVVMPLAHCNNHSNVGGCVPINVTAVNMLWYVWFLYPIAMQSVFSTAYSNASFAFASVIWKGLMSEVNLPRYVWYIGGTGQEGDPGAFLAGGNEWPDYVNTTFMLTNMTLSNNGIYNVSAGNSASYIYDPENPFPTLGGNGFNPDTFTIFGPQAITPPPCGQWDQLRVGPRTDVLHFTGDVLANDTWSLGWASATLYVSSNATDTDFMAQLVDVWPNGTRLLVQQGVVRMRWREGGLNPMPLYPNEVYRINIDMWAVSYVFPAGHAIGLDISSSNYPRYTTNPNNGQPLDSNAPSVIAENTVLFSEQFPSQFFVSIVQPDSISQWVPKTPPTAASSIKAAAQRVREFVEAEIAQA